MMENKTKIDLKNKSIFITGVAGFIGSNLAKRLLSTVEGVKVVGLDNMNNYYDVRLKEARLKELEQFEKFSFVKGNLADKAVIESIFEQYKPEIVVNLGAQAGVRYSITNPDAYVEANLIGFYNILEACRHSYDEGHMLRCLFRNPTYTGAAANGSRQIIAENCHEPYITKEQFHAFPCNLREGENKISIRKSYKKPNPLAKHIVCTCGRALCWHKDKKTGEELFYCRYCRAHKENGKNLKVPAATIYKNVMDALELEHLEEEKLAAAIQQGAGKKAIEVVRAERSVQMKSVLAELNMEQFRRVPLYESYMANEITEEQYHAELMDYEEAHRKLNEQLTAIMEDTLVWERALSLRNPWIQQMAQYKAPEELDRSFVKKYIEQVTVTLLGNGQAEIGLTMKTYEWKQMLGRIETEETDDGTKE